MLKQEEMHSADQGRGEKLRRGQVKQLQGINAVHKGSKITGNYRHHSGPADHGDIEGNITGENNANIFVKGSCKGNIKTAAAASRSTAT